MSKLGIHFPNAGFRNIDALWSIPWQSFVVLHLNREWVPEIRLRFPNATILVRAYLQNWKTMDPLGWAREIALWANELRRFDIEITFANEQNLAAEGHPLGARPGVNYPPESVYQDILQWDMAVIRELRAQIPWAVIHFPALSQGHSDDQADGGYVGFEILREAVQMCDVLDAHTYWDPRVPAQREDVHYGERYRLLHALFPDKPIFISECGTIASGAAEDRLATLSWLEAIPDYVTGACWFIWDSDAKNKSWILRDRPRIVEEMRTYQLTAAALTSQDSIVNPIDIAVALVMGWMAFNPTAYQTTSGESIIGYGHPLQQSEDVSSPISEPQARTLLRNDLQASLQNLEKLVKAPLTANQKGALLSLAFDVGIDKLNGSKLLDRVNEPDHVAAALELKNWQNPHASTPPEIARRRQVESELFLRDLTSDSSSDSSPHQSAAPSAFLSSISSTAAWISAKQGECYQVIGVWYDQNTLPAIVRTKDESQPSAIVGRILVRLEDKSGVGIPCQLVIHQWDSSNGAFEARLSDASGVVWFEQDARSVFTPEKERGPERIQVGDCVVAGLGVPCCTTVGKGEAVHAIRIRRIL